ncbi:serum response factor a isoform X2 [Narcine bancroftii]|uniref:serum response factor a isoform X2 n=1 Tax=Narcine bancroftii TaxID=1343680 RepID=UPI003831433C
MLQSQAGASESALPAGSLQHAAAAPPGRGREPPLASAAYSGSEASSDDDDDPAAAAAPDRRGPKRRLADTEAAAGLVAVSGHEAGLVCGAGLAGGGAVPYGGAGAAAGLKPGKKTRGRVKIKMEFIDNKLRRYTTFSKRKTGIMKKVPSLQRLDGSIQFRAVPDDCIPFRSYPRNECGPPEFFGVEDISGRVQAYELSTLTGTQVLLLVASETGHVYTFATRKLQPMITSETGKALIQTCLNSPDSPPRSDPTSDQRMSATGFEETDLTYQVSETDSSGENKDGLKPTTFTVANVPGSTGINQTVTNTSTNLQVSSGHSFPITNYLAPVTAITNSNGTLFKPSGTATGSMVQLPSGFTLMSGSLPGTPSIPVSQLQQHSLSVQGQQGLALSGPAQPGQAAIFRIPAPAGTQIVSIAGGTMGQQVPVQTIQLHQSPAQVSVHAPTQHTATISDSNSDISQASTSGTMTLPAAMVTSTPSSMASHVMYPSPHGTVMYTTSSPGLSDGLAVLNAFSQPSSAMQVSHGQMQEQGGVPQVLLTAPTGTVQIPLSAVQLHQMTVIGQQSSTGSLTELPVSTLDTTHGTKLAQND